MSRADIYLLGDGILDNFSDMEDGSNDMKASLESLGFSVENLSSGEVSVSNIYQGVRVPSNGRSYPYQDDNGILYFIRAMEKKIQSNRSFSSHCKRFENTNESMVVLSIGGNDVHNNMLKIIMGVDIFMRSLISKSFEYTFNRIMTDIKRSTEKAVLISLYSPFMGEGSRYAKYRTVAAAVGDRWFNFINNVAKRENIAIIDLRNCIDCENRACYSSKDESRLSTASSDCMAKTISHIKTHYEGYGVYNWNERGIVFKTV